MICIIRKTSPNLHLLEFLHFSTDIHRHRYKKLNITITVLTKDEAVLHWWPKDALVDKDFEVVFMPEHAR